MSPRERITSNDLGDAHLNVAAFLMEWDERYGIMTVPEADRLAVERIRQQRQQAAEALGGLTIEQPQTDIL